MNTKQPLKWKHFQGEIILLGGILSNECELRQQKYLNNIIEQDHRFPKKLAKYKSYFQFFYTAWRTLRGYEI